VRERTASPETAKAFFWKFKRTNNRKTGSVLIDPLYLSGCAADRGSH